MTKFEFTANISAALNLFPYLDWQEEWMPGKTLQEILCYAPESVHRNVNYDLLVKKMSEIPALRKARVYSTSTYDSVTADMKSELNFDKGHIVAATFVVGQAAYICYRGTGDGKWRDNGAAMCYPASFFQKTAANYFDTVTDRLYSDSSLTVKELYVTGHSKGGNNAQYAAMMSRNAYRINRCYSFDGQGMSPSGVDMMHEILGSLYKSRKRKIVSINGKNDFVSPLGDTLAEKSNIYYVDTGRTIKGLGGYHVLYNMIDKGLLRFAKKGNRIVSGERGKLGFVAGEINKKLREMPNDDRISACMVMMAVPDIILFNRNTGDTHAKLRDVIPTFSSGLNAIVSAVFSKASRIALSQFVRDAGQDSKHGIKKTGFLLARFTAYVAIALFYLPYQLYRARCYCSETLKARRKLEEKTYQSLIWERQEREHIISKHNELSESRVSHWTNDTRKYVPFADTWIYTVIGENHDNNLKGLSGLLSEPRDISGVSVISFTATYSDCAPYVAKDERVRQTLLSMAVRAYTEIISGRPVCFEMDGTRCSANTVVTLHDMTIRMMQLSQQKNKENSLWYLNPKSLIVGYHAGTIHSYDEWREYSDLSSSEGIRYMGITDKLICDRDATVEELTVKEYEQKMDNVPNTYVRKHTPDGLEREHVYQQEQRDIEHGYAEEIVKY